MILTQKQMDEMLAEDKAKCKFKVEIWMEDEDMARDFCAYWLDGGGDQGFCSSDEAGEKFYYTHTNWESKDPNKTTTKYYITRTDHELD